VVVHFTFVLAYNECDDTYPTWQEIGFMRGMIATLWKLTSCAASAMLIFAAAASAAETDPTVDFQSEIRPILAENCFRCHGNDGKAREAGLRLDQREIAVAPLKDGVVAITPGDAAKSMLIKRVSSNYPDFHMPPPETGKRLTPHQIDLLKRWINQGAKYTRFWSFIPPVKHTPPTVNHPQWVRNPIDNFIAARLEKQGLEPSPQADKRTLIRRVTFDLTGLPPTIDEVDDFLADKNPKAYEKVVDRLLDSQRYGEHMSRYWLDAVRYGDTHGMHLDNYREMWKYRDWIINAFNRDKPFDQFTIEQLAGDLLPNATLDQKIATGYVRANITTSEGGAIDEEFLVRYAEDRVKTTSTVWMGLTAGCAVCHDHKYDPITQKEFYQLFAFFNNTAEKAMDGNAKAPPPVIRVPTDEQKQRLDTLDTQLRSVRAEMTGPQPSMDLAQAEWENDWRKRLNDQWQVLDPLAFTSQGGASLSKLDDHSVLAEGENPDTDVYDVTAHTVMNNIVAIRLDALTDPSLPNNGPGRADNSNFVLTEFQATVAPADHPDQTRTVRFVAAEADHEQADRGFTIEKAIDHDFSNNNGWAVEGFNRRENRTAIFIPAEPIGFKSGTEIRVKMTFASLWANHAIGRFKLSVSNDSTMAPSTLGTWQVLGPFTAENGAEAYNTNFGPEPTPDLDASYTNSQNKNITWQPRPDLVDGKVHPLTGQNAATYLYRTIHCPSDRELKVSLGSDDAIRLWLNGEQVLANNTQRAAAPNQDQATLKLRPGENQLLMKIVNYAGDYAFYFNKAEGDSGGLPLAIVDTLKLEPAKRNEKQNNAIRD